jgi:hypothetical protein
MCPVRSVTYVSGRSYLRDYRLSPQFPNHWVAAVWASNSSGKLPSPYPQLPFDRGWQDKICYPAKGSRSFGQILERLDLRAQLIFWEGRYFLASTWLDEVEKVGVEFRSRDNGIAFTFRNDDWQAIRSLFRRGWQWHQQIRSFAE